MRAAKKLKAWLAENDDKPGKTGKPKKSNLTDNDSAKMKTSHVVIQGYDGVAAVDDRHQVIIHAEAFGEAQEHDLFQPVLAATQDNFEALGERHIYKKAKVTADSGFHTERNAEYLYEQKIDGYLADRQMRKRDPRFQDVDKFKAPKSACRDCHLRSRCLKYPDRTEVRQVAFFSGETRKPETFTSKMKRKIDLRSEGRRRSMRNGNSTASCINC